MARIRTVTIRVPESWCGQVNSRWMRQMLAGWLQHPRPLPADPGPGGAYLRLSIPERPLDAFVEAVGGDQSVALRRLIAANLPLPAGRPRARIPAAQVASKAVPRVEILSKPALPPAREIPKEVGPASPATAPMLLECPWCRGWVMHRWRNGRFVCTGCEAREQALWCHERQGHSELACQRLNNPGAFLDRYGLLILEAGIAGLAVFGLSGLLIPMLAILGAVLDDSEGAVLGAVLGALIALLRKASAVHQAAPPQARVMPVSQGFLVWVPVKP